MSHSIMFAQMGGESVWSLLWDASFLLRLIVVLLGAFLVGALLIAFAYTVFFLVSLPARRQERARFFLDIIEAGLEKGLSPEHIIVAVAGSRDKSVGARFHLLAAHVANGLRLTQAIEKVPRFLPPQMNAMLIIGERLGDVRRVLPACRGALQDSSSQLNSALNYVLLLAFVFAPVSPILFVILQVFVLPKYLAIFAEIGSVSLVKSSIVQMTSIIRIQLVLVAVLYVFAILYLGGPRLTSWSRAVFGTFLDKLQLSVPWRRKRIHRDFTSMLSLLLDGGISEVDAIQLAAQSTANAVFVSKAAIAVRDLQSGQKLPQALAQLDNSGEFEWRLRNANAGGVGFATALRGWLEALNAKAFQQEQAAAHVITTGLVMINGLLVGLLVSAIFGLLIAFIYEGLLW